MIHLDLFSGIGGNAIAAEAVWPDVEHIFCEINPKCEAKIADPEKKGKPIPCPHRQELVSDLWSQCKNGHRQVQFPRAVLRKSWPQSTIHDDIRTLKLSALPAGIDILTGGFPCQPFSAAGNRRGTDDDRHLWPEMLRVIREVRPRWVVGENVRGFVNWNGGLVFDQVQSDLEDAGYEVIPFVLPAAGVNAPHRRERVWIVAHARGAESGWISDKRTGKTLSPIRSEDRTSPDAEGGRRGRSEPKGNGRGESEKQVRDDHPDVAHPGDARLEGGEQPGSLQGRGAEPHGTASESGGGALWGENWTKVATRLCPLDDELSRRLVRLPDGSTISRSAWRREALKGAGNAIVPPVLMQIFKVIKQIDDAR